MNSMCFICDGGTPDELVREIDQHIEEVGWHVSGVEDPIPWVYTIGLTERFGHPELIMTDICCAEHGMSVVNGIGERIAAGERFQAGDEVWSPDGDTSARLGAVHPGHWSGDRLAGWCWYYDDKPWVPPRREALQVIWRGRSGRWQDDHRNKRWMFERLDRAPLPAPAGQRRPGERRADRRRRSRTERRARHRRR